MWKPWRTLMEKIMTTDQAQRKETPSYFSLQPYLQVNKELSLFADSYLRAAPFHTSVSCCYVIHFPNNMNARPDLDFMQGKDIFVFQNVQAGRRVNPASYQTSKTDSFSGYKALGSKAIHSRAF